MNQHMYRSPVIGEIGDVSNVAYVCSVNRLEESAFCVNHRVTTRLPLPQEQQLVLLINMRRDSSVCRR